MFKLDILFDFLVFLIGCFETLFFATLVGTGTVGTAEGAGAAGAGVSTVGVVDTAMFLRRGFLLVDSNDSRALMVGLRTRDEFRMSDALVGLEGPSAVPSDSTLPIYWSSVQLALPVLSGKSISETSCLGVSSAAVLLVRRLPGLVGGASRVGV